MDGLDKIGIESDLNHWFSILQSKSEKTEKTIVFIVGTHLDYVPSTLTKQRVKKQFEEIVNSIIKKYSNYLHLKGCFIISNSDKGTISEFHKSILEFSTNYCQLPG